MSARALCSRSRQRSSSPESVHASPTCARFDEAGYFRGDWARFCARTDRTKCAWGPLARARAAVIFNKKMGSSTKESAPPLESGRRPTYRSTRPRQSAKPPPSPSESSLAVLVIDDDDMVRRALVRGLRRNHAVVDLRDAESALELIASGRRFDAILCDMNLGGMSGHDFFLNLDAIAEDQARRTIILSGDPSSLAPELFGELPPRFLDKPAPIAKIEAVLAELALLTRAA